MNLTVQRIVRIAVFSALAIGVSLLTKMQSSLNIFHLGPIVIVTSAILLGKVEGAFIGGLSMGIFDVLFYNPASAPKTVLAYGLLGFIVGYIAMDTERMIPNTVFRYIIAILSGGIVYIGTYFLISSMTIGVPTAVMEAYGDVFIVVAMLFAVPIAISLKKYVKIK